MIQTTIPINYDVRSNKLGFILIDIPSFICTKHEKIFTINDFILNNDGTKQIYQSKEVTKTNEELNQLDAYLESNYDFSEMTSQQKEWKKIQLGLMLDVTTNLLENGKTIYIQDAEVWTFTP